MLDPAVALGAPVMLYRVNPDLSPDLSSMGEQIRSAPVPIRALLVAHFFGFRQCLEGVTALCREHGVSLIEDCSHALAGVRAPGTSSALGMTGDYAIASPYKFLPSPDGGLLWGAELPPQDLDGDSPGLAEQLRACVHAVGSVLRNEAASHVDTSEELARMRQTDIPAAREWVSLEDDPSPQYDATQERSNCLAVTRWIARHADIGRVTSRRRENFQRWLHLLGGVQGCRPLFPELPEDCVPYMFPLVLKQPQTDFPLLKRLGLPIWRWDEMAISDCSVAGQYRLSLLHLPCHQELSFGDVDWMAAAIQGVCSETAGEVRS